MYDLVIFHAKCMSCPVRIPFKDQDTALSALQNFYDAYNVNINESIATSEGFYELVVPNQVLYNLAVLPHHALTPKLHPIINRTQLPSAEQLGNKLKRMGRSDRMVFLAANRRAMPVNGRDVYYVYAVTREQEQYEMYVPYGNGIRVAVLHKEKVESTVDAVDNKIVLLNYVSLPDIPILLFALKETVQDYWERTRQ